jgi:KaiC/GvpD/RAD55 family RecA-like ATPase
MQVDVTTRLGALAPVTPTGFATLDRLLNGGLRSGTVVALSGSPGVGRTAFALLVAYIAARSKAGVVFAGARLDPTEIMARLAARALHREYANADTTYGDIWSGKALNDDVTRRPVADAVETVIKKVGAQLHLYRASSLESTQSLFDCAAQQWARHDRVVLVVDDVEAFCATGDGSASKAATVNSSVEARVMQVAHELKQIADQGCAVLFTSLARHADLVAPAATLAAELRPPENVGSGLSERVLGLRSLELRVTKNRLGPTGSIGLGFIPGAFGFEERAAERA